MKKVLITIFTTIILFLGSFNHAFSQVSKLDKKNGFNKFILGSTLNSINDIAKLKQVANNTPNSETYVITDIENYSITGHPIQNILLTFYKKKLFRISVLMPPIDARVGSSATKNSMEVIDKLVGEYGKITKLDLTPEDKSDNIVHKSNIDGSNVSLFIIQYGLDWIDDQPYSKGNIYTFLSRDIYYQMEKELKSDSGF